MRLRTLLLATFSLLPLSLPAAETLDSLIAAHARKPLYAEASLSPTGEYLAAIATVDEQQSLVMLRLKDLKLVSALKLRGQEGAEHVLDYWWSGPGEVVATLGRRFGDRDTVFSTGEMMAMRANDSYVRYVAGYRGRASSSSQDSFTEMLDPTPTIPDSMPSATRKTRPTSRE